MPFEAEQYFVLDGLPLVPVTKPSLNTGPKIDGIKHEEIYRYNDIKYF